MLNISEIIPITKLSTEAKIQCLIIAQQSFHPINLSQKNPLITVKRLADLVNRPGLKLSYLLPPETCIGFTPTDWPRAAAALTFCLKIENFDGSGNLPQ